jgi:hypothetical protein
MIDPIYGGFTGALKNIATRFKLNKPHTDIKKEAVEARNVELNVNIAENHNDIHHGGSSARGKYRLPNNNFSSDNHIQNNNDNHHNDDHTNSKDDDNKDSLDVDLE